MVLKARRKVGRVEMICRSEKQDDVAVRERGRGTNWFRRQRWTWVVGWGGGGPLEDGGSRKRDNGGQ